MTEFLTGNEWWRRLARTVAQGVLGVLVANLDLLVGTLALAPEWRALSPVMAEVGKHVAPAGEIEEGGSDE